MGNKMVKEHTLTLMEIKYVGEFKDDKQNGQGTKTFGKGKWEGDKYVGE